MTRHQSKEDYLERILILQESNDIVRVTDIAHDMNYSKPSVSIALKKLKNEGLVEVDLNSGNVSLTESGKELAIEVYERHKIISSALIMIGVDPKIAKEEACELEHDISHETFLKLKEFIEKRK